MTKRAVLFDLDETLIDRRAGLKIFAARLWQEGLTNAASETDFLQVFIALDANGGTPRKAFFAALCAQFMPEVDSEKLLARFLAEAWHEPKLFPDALVVLQTLESRGYSIGIVSNGSSVTQRAKLNNTALKEWSDVAVISEEFGVNKPDSAIYAHALTMLGTSAEATWFVGDCAVNDVIGPTALGIKSIWIERHGAWPAQYEKSFVAHVTSLQEILDVIN